MDKFIDGVLLLAKDFAVSVWVCIIIAVLYLIIGSAIEKYEDRSRRSNG